MELRADRQFSVESDLPDLFQNRHLTSDFLIRMRISSQILEIDLALYFRKIASPHRENFHFS